jgi:TadE-like protein
MMESKYHRSSLFKRILSKMRRQPRGQSFVELMLVMLFLALLLAAVVEYGFMLNNYLHVLDGAREAARISNTDFAFTQVGQAMRPQFYYAAAEEATNTIAPIKLDPSKGDDIIISVYGVAGTNVDQYPSSTGWSLCANYAALVNYFWTNDPNHPADQLQSVPPPLADVKWYSCPTPLNVSHFSKSNIQNITSQVANAPNAGILVVEIFYNYPQLLKLPVLTSIVPDPIPLYLYSIMPMSSAEPTVVPTPTP